VRPISTLSFDLCCRAQPPAGVPTYADIGEFGPPIRGCGGEAEGTQAQHVLDRAEQVAVGFVSVFDCFSTRSSCRCFVWGKQDYEKKMAHDMEEAAAQVLNAG